MGYVNKEDERKWRAANRIVLNAKRRARCQKHRNAVIDKLGGKCRCGFTDRRALQIDHIHGGGTQERLKLQSYELYLHMLKNLDKYQVLCANCNQIKRIENNEIGGRPRQVT